MIKVINAAERHQANIGDWLQSFNLFSFADYYDPKNVQFGPLRILNDDYVGPQSGFPSHPHSDMEVVTMILSGSVTHHDSLGNETTVTQGQVQRVTAGTGLTHSLHNNTDGEAHLLNLWFIANQKGLAPSYEVMDMDFTSADGKLIPVITGQKVLEDVAFMNSNSTVYYGSLKNGNETDFQTFKIRKTLVYVLTGNLLVNNVELEAGDHVRLESMDVISLHGATDATFILVDVPATEANY